MQISTKGRYALRLMLDLAVHNTGELVKIKDISARENISEKISGTDLREDDHVWNRTGRDRKDLSGDGHGHHCI